MAYFRLRKRWRCGAAITAAFTMMLALPRQARHVRVMLNILSILVGLFVLLLTMIGFIPLLGWLNWITIPIGIVGLALGALSSSNTGRNLNIVLIIVCAIRLFIGGGLL
jgi:hypothetical protein